MSIQLKNNQIISHIKYVYLSDKINPYFRYVKYNNIGLIEYLEYYDYSKNDVLTFLIKYFNNLSKFSINKDGIYTLY